MDYIVFCMILGILFWVLAALALVVGMAYVYVELQYYKWSKEQREKDGIVKEIQEAVKKAIEEIDEEQYEEELNSGGNLTD